MRKLTPARTPRGRALRWLTLHRGITEQPPGSNTDRRADGIRAAQLRVRGSSEPVPWCGVWAGAALMAGGVKGIDARIASVYWIELQAKGGNRPFRGWTTDRRRVRRGDLVVLFGEGVHVGVVRRFVPGFVITDEGNTSAGQAGSQDNGGGAYRRVRPLKSVHGFALVRYPGE